MGQHAPMKGLQAGRQAGWKAGRQAASGGVALLGLLPPLWPHSCPKLLPPTASWPYQLNDAGEGRADGQGLSEAGQGTAGLGGHATGRQAGRQAKQAAVVCGFVAARASRGAGVSGTCSATDGVGEMAGPCLHAAVQTVVCHCTLIHLPFCAQVHGRQPLE